MTQSTQPLIFPLTSAPNYKKNTADRPTTLWITGLSASGKSTIALALANQLIAQNKICYVLDGDNIRNGLNRDLGFSIQDRSENIRRIAEVAKLMNEAGVIVITAFISPLIEDRALAKSIIGPENFREIYLSTPIEACEERDPKGLYKKARSGELAEFTGISSPYEPPTHPDLTLDTTQLDVAHCATKILKLINNF